MSCSNGYKIFCVIVNSEPLEKMNFGVNPGVTLKLTPDLTPESTPPVVNTESYRKIPKATEINRKLSKAIPKAKW